MQTHLAQIGPNRPQKDMRIGWDKNRLGPDRVWKDWLLKGCNWPNFFFGPNNFSKDAQQDCIQRPKVQIVLNRLQKKIRIGWDENPLGPDRV